MPRPSQRLFQRNDQPDTAGTGKKMRSYAYIVMSAACLAPLQIAVGCTPTVALEVPREPIVINMNIKVEHEIRVNVDDDLERLLKEEKEIF